MDTESTISRRWRVPAAAVLCCALWEITFPCMGMLYRSFGAEDRASDQIFLAGIRFAGAGGILLLSEALRGFPVFSGFSRPGHLAQAAGFGLLQTGVQYACFYLSMDLIPAGRASLLNTTNAFLSVLLAHFFCDGDRLNRNKIVGCALGLLGIVLLCGDAQATGTLAGDTLMMASALSFSAGNIVCQRLSRHFRPVSLAGWQMLFGGLALSAIGAAGGVSLRTGAAEGWVLTGFLILQSAVTFALWGALLTRARVSSVGIYTCLIPIIGVLSSLVLPDEPPLSGTIFFSMLCCALGVILVNAAPHARPARRLTDIPNKIQSEIDAVSTKKEMRDPAPPELQKTGST